MSPAGWPRACTGSGRRFQDIELHITADLAAIVDLRQRTFDVALRFGTGVYPGLHAEHLMDDTIPPVASPRYLAEAARSRTQPTCS